MWYFQHWVALGRKWDLPLGSALRSWERDDLGERWMALAAHCLVPTQDQGEPEARALVDCPTSSITQSTRISWRPHLAGFSGTWEGWEAACSPLRLDKRLSPRLPMFSTSHLCITVIGDVIHLCKEHMHTGTWYCRILGAIKSSKFFLFLTHFVNFEV